MTVFTRSGELFGDIIMENSKVKDKIHNRQIYVIELLVAVRVKKKHALQ